MPGRNGTGPDGQGSGSGRKLGKCKSSLRNNENTVEESQGQGKRRRIQQSEGDEHLFKAHRRGRGNKISNE